MRYKLKPFFVDAILWTGDLNTIEGDCDWFLDAIAENKICIQGLTVICPGRGFASPQQFVVRSWGNIIFPLTKEQFLKSYVPVIQES